MRIQEKTYRSFKGFGCEVILAISFIIIISAFAVPAWSAERLEAKADISAAQKAFDALDKNSLLKRFVPHKEYYSARVYLDTAQYQFSEERDYSNASYFAIMALVEAETAFAIARTRLARYNKIKVERKYYSEIARAPVRPPSIRLTLKEAGFYKEENQYQRLYLDSQLFTSGILELSDKGKKRLDAVANALKLARRITFEISAFTPESGDAVTFAEKKAALVEGYLKSQKGLGHVKFTTKAMNTTDGLVIGGELYHANGIAFTIIGMP